MAKKTVSYKGKNYEVIGTVEHNRQSFLKLEGLEHKVPENLTSEVKTTKKAQAEAETSSTDGE